MLWTLSFCSKVTIICLWIFAETAWEWNWNMSTYILLLVTIHHCAYDIGMYSTFLHCYERFRLKACLVLSSRARLAEPEFLLIFLGAMNGKWMENSITFKSGSIIFVFGSTLCMCKNKNQSATLTSSQKSMCLKHFMIKLNNH